MLSVHISMKHQFFSDVRKAGIVHKEAEEAFHRRTISLPLSFVPDTIFPFIIVNFFTPLSMNVSRCCPHSTRTIRHVSHGWKKKNRPRTSRDLFQLNQNKCLESLELSEFPQNDCPMINM